MALGAALFVPAMYITLPCIHAAMVSWALGCGGCRVMVGLVNTHYVYLPIPVVIQAPRLVDPRGALRRRHEEMKLAGMRCLPLLE